MSSHIFRYLIHGDLAVGDEVTLDQSDSHHLIRVVRRGVGEGVELLGPEGTLWPAELIRAEVPAVVKVVGEPAAAPPPAPIRLYLGLLDWSRLDALHAQLTEVGVGEVVVFSSERSGRIPKAQEWERRVARLDRVAESAARQSGSPGLPEVRGVVPFPEVIADISEGHGYLLHPLARTSLTAALAGRSDVSADIIVGPEAGFSENELLEAKSVGIAVCGLGARVLRTGTAAIVAVTAAMAALGALEQGD